MSQDDMVNHPSHYKQYKGFEVIDVCEQLRAPDGTGNYNRGNAFKYLARAGWKNIDKQLEDLKKAEFYIKREIERISDSNDTPTTFDVAEVNMLINGPYKMGGAFVCVTCNFQLKPDPNRPGWFFCENGHGAMKPKKILEEETTPQVKGIDVAY